MKKKYQVFISSTFSDLIEERATVAECLLKMDCIPVGMEQFPASNMSQSDFIRTMLDDCDYLVLILAGRYGTPCADGVSFTEKEYDYAIRNNIPVMSFVLEDPEQLPLEKREKSDEGRKKFAAFRKKVCDGKVVRFYSDSSTVCFALATSLHRCIQDYPAVGWVRGDSKEKPEGIEEKITEYMRMYRIPGLPESNLFTGFLSADPQSAGDSKDPVTEIVKGARSMMKGFTKGLFKWDGF